MSIFDEADLAGQAAIAAVFGGTVIRVVPMAGDLNYGGAADNSRAPVSTTCVFSSASKTMQTDYPGTQRNGADVAVAQTELWIDAGSLALIPYALKRGDKIEVRDGATVKATYSVVTAEHGDHGDLRVVVAR